MPRRSSVALVVAVAALVATAFVPAGAETLQPSQWPTNVVLGSAPNAIRYAGTDRYATSAALALGLRGGGGFPFDDPDRTSGGASSLAEANGWWGAATCPRSIIVTAGDTPADSLAAAPLSDPTNRSDEPRLQRVAAADPLFDPIGGFDRVDTAYAPIIVTASARAGAHALSTSARAAASDLATGGCTDAREAIIVGGDAAVPVEAESELVSLGYEEVFRVAGTDRFDTAARIATALGTEAPAAGATCVDPDTTDGDTNMGFYGNAVIEFRPDATHCELRSRTVVLADGATGADALAAGWWTSYWQVPVLLVARDGSLPAATRTALQTLAIDSIVVLGGTGRIPETTVDEAKRLAGAAAGRFAGVDRYDTSVVMARAFGGWFPTGSGADFDGDRVCLAASSGGGATATGWPDALAAGPWCGRLAASGAGSPSRAIPPAETGAGTTPAVGPSHQAVPVLLVPARAETNPPSVDDLLSTSFPSGEAWCRSAVSPGCLVPGFAVVFGGTGTVSDASVVLTSLRLTGDTVPGASDAQLEPGFATTLDLRPVYRSLDAVTTAPHMCFGRGAATNVRWIASYDDPDLVAYLSAAEVSSDGLYGDDGSLPACLAVDDAADGDIAAIGVSPTGVATTPQLFVRDDARRITMSGPFAEDGPISSAGDPGTSTTSATTTWHFRDAPASPLTVRDRGVETAVASGVADVTLVRSAAGDATFEATLALTTSDGRQVAAVAGGEAVLQSGRWELAGGALAGTARGGFRATLVLNGTATNDDDGLSWRIDGSYP